ncbi:MAG: nitroreductase family protein [Solobacterium sp.]|nr:nitroreductase family protein [Solobacterium sp.]
MKEIFHRTSIRKFDRRPVEDEKIEKLLRAAMAAPSAGNQQPWAFFVVREKDLLSRLGSSTPYSLPAANAPLAIVPCFQKACMMPEYAQIDLSAATENILLEADHLELGAVWLGIAPAEDRMRTVEQILSIPDTLRAFCIIAVGYPLEEKTQEDRYDVSRIYYPGAVRRQLDLADGKISLKEIIEELEAQDNNQKTYFDKEELDYLYVLNEENPDEEDRYAMELVEEDPERYAVMPTKYEIHEYRIMESFVKSLETSDAQNRLDNAIHGPGAFRRFREVARQTGTEDRWRRFRDRAYRDIAADWCRENGIQYKD